LLLNILPASIATTLKTGVTTVARYHDETSILFADVANFTPLAARLSPATVVDLLNEVFTEFDQLVDKHGLEKIKTIGDAYMVAAGVPEPRDDHALVITQLAVEMMAVVAERRFQGCELAFRVGINSGPVVAGVIGRRKFSYDLWGDTVNIASRLEQFGIPGRIQIGEATQRLIEGRFATELRGPVELKGKGLVTAYFVTPEPTATPELERSAAPGAQAVGEGAALAQLAPPQPA
jgi:guanylate cyclase